MLWYDPAGFVIEHGFQPGRQCYGRFVFLIDSAPGLDGLFISFTRFIWACGQRDDARRLTRFFALTGTGVRAAGVGYAPAKFKAAPLHGPDR
jgi:hypothetical protein